jgi:hypothetical protein
MQEIQRNGIFQTKQFDTYDTAEETSAGFDIGGSGPSYCFFSGANNSTHLKIQSPTKTQLTQKTKPRKGLGPLYRDRVMVLVHAVETQESQCQEETQ